LAFWLFLEQNIAIFKSKKIRMRKRLVFFCLLSLVFLLIISLSMGESGIGLNSLVHYILTGSISPMGKIVITEIRLPRSLAALLTGAALGMSGAMLQGMLRNPLASPYLLGISSGAGVCVVILISLNVVATWIPIGAWLGAVLAAILVFMIAYNKRVLTIERLILSGVAISSLLGSIQAVFLLRSDDARIQNSLTWLSGTLAGRDWSDIQFTWAPITVVTLISILLSKKLNLAMLDDDTSQSLGLSILHLRVLVGLLATILTACAVCIAGLVGFVGLVIPHIVRLIFGYDFKLILPISALLGSIFVLSADIIARNFLGELPVGLVTSLIGSPFFVYILRKSRAKSFS